ncbi:MAG: hypothetical protein GX605_12045 [Chloroflexi bacterium]|nr:hypothetical protein [Chloroflexota bacterium]
MDGDPYLSLLSGWPVTGVLLALAALLVAWRGWRLSLLALALSHIALGVHLANLTQAAMLPVHMLTGGLTAAMLWLALFRAAGVDPEGEPWGQGAAWLRVAAAGLAVLAALALSWVYRLPGLADHQTAAAFGLFLCAALALAGRRPAEPTVFAGLFSLLGGAELVSLGVSRSLALGAAFGGLHLLVAATFSYVLHAARGTEDL